MSNEPRPAQRTLVAIIGGAVLGTLAWLVLVPWDLSEVDPEERSVGSGGDDHGASIGLVAAMVLSLAVVLVLRRSTRRLASWFALGGLGAWAALFAWRTGSAETAGANLFMVPLVTVVVPVAIAGPSILRRVSGRLDRQRA